MTSDREKKVEVEVKVLRCCSRYRNKIMRDSITIKTVKKSLSFLSLTVSGPGTQNK